MYRTHRPPHCFDDHTSCLASFLVAVSYSLLLIFVHVQCKSLVCLVCFFFFQAEDGIRDVAVTGVQTCALPISLAQRLLNSFALLSLTLLAYFFSVESKQRERVEKALSESEERLRLAAQAGKMRSEERREGKSVDLGGRRIIKKKKKRKERQR